MGQCVENVVYVVHSKMAAKYDQVQKQPDLASNVLSLCLPACLPACSEYASAKTHECITAYQLAVQRHRKYRCIETGVVYNDAI